jgi:hypothetical protein
MLVKTLINILFLLIIAVSSLPVKQASNFFFKSEVQDEMQEDCCDIPLKKTSDTVGFKDFPCCYHHAVAVHPVSQSLPYHLCHADWQLPLWPAVEVHTPPP